MKKILKRIFHFNHEWKYNDINPRYATMRRCALCGKTESSHGNGVLNILNDRFPRRTS
jgi:hypothetical protein